MSVKLSRALAQQQALTRGAWASTLPSQKDPQPRGTRPQTLSYSKSVQAVNALHACNAYMHVMHVMHVNACNNNNSHF